MVKTVPVCSGILQPYQVVERTASFAGVNNDVSKLCSSKNYKEDWRDLCKMTVDTVSN